MQMQELTIKRRESTGKQIAKRLRRDGVVPAILYGGAKNEPVTVDPRAVLRMISGVRGDRAGVSVEWPGADVTHYHQNGGGNKKQRRGSTRHRGCSVMTRRFAVKRRSAARRPR